MAEFKPTELDQVAYVFDKIVKAKEWEDRAAGAGVWVSALDIVHKGIHAYERYCEEKIKEKDFSTPSKIGIIGDIMAVATAKAFQDFCKWQAAANTPSKAESDLASKFMPSKDGDYEKIVELLITKKNESIIEKAKKLFDKIDDDIRKFDEIYKEIKNRVDIIQLDKNAANATNSSYGVKASEAPGKKNKYERAANIHKEVAVDPVATEDEKKNTMLNIEGAYKEGQKLSIDIAGYLSDIKSISDAGTKRTNGKALSEATKTAFNTIASAWNWVKDNEGDGSEAKKAAEAAAQAANTNAGTANTAWEKNLDKIDWKNAAVYYWSAYRLAQVAFSDFGTLLTNNKIHSNDDKKEQLTNDQTALEKAIKDNKLKPIS